jgi:putative exosortase-associated protein (TIGR04073 family)
MRHLPLLLPLAAAVLLVGCAGPEQKLARGLRNTTELARGGEMSRSIEQTYLWDGPKRAYSDGVVRGFNRTMARTGVGIYEIITFPIPPYGPVFAPKNHVFPDPSIATEGGRSWGGFALTEEPASPANGTVTSISAPLFDTDTYLGFSGGTVFPMLPGNRFHIFDH